MATFALRGLDPEVIARAKDRAREDGTTLDAVLRDYLQTYAYGRIRGGLARAASLTPERRSEIARLAAAKSAEVRKAKAHDQG